MNFSKAIQSLQKYYLLFFYITSSWLIIEAVALLSDRYHWHKIIFDYVLVAIFIGLVVIIVASLSKKKTQSKKIQLLLVDDEQAIREIIKFNLDDSENYEIVAEASNGIEAIELLGSCKINIVLADLEMPQMDGIQLTKSIRRLYPEVKIIILTMSSDNTKIQELLKLGVDGYVQKEFLNDELERSINVVNHGGIYYSQVIKNVISDSIKEISHKHTVGKQQIQLEM
jgi:DNA-binding NarL/FixJ family response regulator